MSGKTTFVLIIAIAILAACNNNSSGSRQTTYKPVDINIPKNAGSPIPGQIQPQTNTNPVVSPVTITQPVTQTSNTAVGLNPEHGKPGHRCDIAVGAPLNSQPTTPTVTTNTPTTSTPITINQADLQKTFTSDPITTTPTKAGLNPEHGKPGHRCDIAVGAPLDSKPTVAPAVTTTPVTTTPTNTTTSIPQVTPIMPASSNPVKADATATTAGLNPEHGKPGHRCDIAVGAPLDSKPVDKKN